MGSIADKMRTNKIVFLIGLITGEIMLLGMYFSKSIAVYLAFYLGLGLLMAPMSSILDTWTLKSLNFDVGLYSRAVLSELRDMPCVSLLWARRFLPSAT